MGGPTARARVYYRPPVHRRDLAEAISKIVGQKTVNQSSFSYGDGRRSKQVSKTGQSILDADEIANLNDDVRTAIDEIPIPRGQPSPEELEQMARALAEITYYADPEALAAFAEAA